MPTLAQRKFLNLEKTNLANAHSEHDKRQAANSFRYAVAFVAGEINFPNCLTALADPNSALNEDGCQALIDLLEANSVPNRLQRNFIRPSCACAWPFIKG